MILTCPDCATSYFVDDDRVPPQGRTVKCTSCGNRWRAMPEGETEPAAEAPSPPVRTEPAVVAPEVAAVVEDDLEFVPAPAVSKRRTVTPKKRPVGLYVGAGVAAILIGAVAAVVLMRQQVVGMVPDAAPMFSALGLPVNTLGLVIENDVKFQAVLQAGRPVLSITGSIRNTGHKSVEAPPIRINLLDKAGKAVAGLLAEPLNAHVPPGGRRYFAVSLPDPPTNASVLEIGFDVGAKLKVPMAEGHGAAEPAHETPIEAKPLPASSPDALTPHEQH